MCWWPEVYSKNLFGYVEHLWYSIKLFWNLLIGRKDKLIIILDVCLDLNCTHEMNFFFVCLYRDSGKKLVNSLELFPRQVNHTWFGWRGR